MKLKSYCFDRWL